MRNPAELQLAAETDVIAGFKEAWAKMAMNLNRCPMTLSLLGLVG
jgi:hypothetical protein